MSHKSWSKWFRKRVKFVKMQERQHRLFDAMQQRKEADSGKIRILTREQAQDIFGGN